MLVKSISVPSVQGSGALDVASMTDAELDMLFRDPAAPDGDRSAAGLERLERGPQSHSVVLRGGDAVRMLGDIFGVTLTVDAARDDSVYVVTGVER